MRVRVQGLGLEGHVLQRNSIGIMAIAIESSGFRARRE